MTKKTKRALFYSAMAVFLLLSYIVILYAQGYKYSFSENKFLRTGAISLKVNTGAKVYLDSKLHGDTSFFNSAYSIDRLLPGTYKITVQKDGYSSWQKTAIVEEGFVIDFPRVMLLSEEGDKEQELFDEVDLLFKELKPIATIKPTTTPTPISKERKSSSSTTLSLTKSEKQNQEFPDITTPEFGQEPYILDSAKGILYRNANEQLEKVASSVKGFRLSGNKNKLAWWNSNELWIIWLNDQNYQPSYKQGDKEVITSFQIPIQNGAWFRDEDHIILELDQRDSKGRPYSIYRVIEIDKRGGVNIIEI